MALNKTLIDWVKNPDGTQGFTWNPITGCLNGCEYCYARKLANGRLKSRYLANDNIANPIATGTRDDIEAEAMDKLNDPFYPRFWEDRLNELNPVYGQDHRAMFKGIFVCDMSDLFGIGIPEGWTRKVMERIKEFPYHRFYLLTKQPQNLIKFSPFPDNCWVGVSATDNDMAFKAADSLRQIEAGKTFISFEPLLGQIIKWVGDKEYLLKNLDWVIIGSQTKPYKPPKIEWVEEIVEACDKAGVPAFLKDNLAPLLGKALLSKEQREVIGINAYSGLLRQEMPK